MSTSFSDRTYFRFQALFWGLLTAGSMLVATIYEPARISVPLLELLTRSLTALGSHAIWRWLQRRHLLTAGWTKVLLAAVPLALVLGLGVSVVTWLPYARVYSAEYLRVGRELMAWTWGIEHCSVSLLWLGFILGYYHSVRSQAFALARAESLVAAKSAQLRALKSQLRPRFLFSSFRTVETLIAQDPTRAREALSQLSELLRYSLLGAERHLVSLDEELRVVAIYLELEQLRLGPALKVVAQIAPDTAAQVPPLLIQNVIENAVRFGPAANESGGEVTYEVRIRSGRLTVRVTNSGRVAPDAGSMAPDHTRERLRLIYGTAAQYSLQQETPDRVAAFLSLPIRPPDE